MLHCGLLVLSMLYSLPVFPVCSQFLLTLLLLFDNWASLAHCGVWRMAAISPGASCWRICVLIAVLFCLFVVLKFSGSSSPLLRAAGYPGSIPAILLLGVGTWDHDPSLCFPCLASRSAHIVLFLLIYLSRFSDAYGVGLSTGGF